MVKINKQIMLQNSLGIMSVWNCNVNVIKTTKNTVNETKTG